MYLRRYRYTELKPLATPNTKNIIVNIGGIGALDNNKLNLIETLFAYEKQKLIDTMNRGKDVAKENGNYREGRKKTYTREVEEYVVKLLNRGNSYREITKMTGVSISTISRIRKPTPMPAPNT